VAAGGSPPSREGPQLLGELLQRHRLAAGLSQEELAERAGLSERGISDLERGLRQAPYPATLRRLAEALGLPEAERAALLAALGERDERTTVLRTPMMVHLLSTILWRFEPGSPVRPSGTLTRPLIYQLAVDDWLNEERHWLGQADGRSVRQPETYRQFLRLLARGMQDRGVTSLAIGAAVDLLAKQIEDALKSDSSLPHWWPATEGPRGNRLWRGTKRRLGRTEVDREDLRRLLGELSEGTLLRVTGP
jgi:transcriptional regulator with XRE-family HTH domain